MKQPEDNKTIDMIEQVKRGRGRPRVENPLTPAERAKRYRANKKKFDTPINVTPQSVTNKSNEVFRLECEIQALKTELESYRQFHEQRRELDDDAQRQFDALRVQNEVLVDELKAARDQIAQLRLALVEFMNARTSKKRVTEERVREMLELLSMPCLKKLK